MVNEVTDPTISLREVSGWMDTINESVHTSDDHDIGDIEAVNRDFIVVKRGFVNVHRYYIPISKVQGWDGNVLWLSIPEEMVNTNYERDTIPDPSLYYVKGEEEKYTGTLEGICKDRAKLFCFQICRYTKGDKRRTGGLQVCLMRGYI
jgi:hypothetical protein